MPVLLDPVLLAELKLVAEAQGRNISEVIETALREYFESCQYLLDQYRREGKSSKGVLYVEAFDAARTAVPV